MKTCRHPRSHRARHLLLGSLLAAAEIVADVSGQIFSPVSANAKPKIKQQPVSLTVEQGQPATFKVEVEPDPPAKDHLSFSTVTLYGEIGYQWMKNGARLNGATTATLSVAHTQPADAGAYQVVVSNERGWVSSQSVSLNVIITIPASIVTHPLSMTTSEGRSVMFAVVAAGTPSPTYRWRKNGSFIAGATTPTLTLSNAQTDDAGDYDVLVANSRNSVLSRPATLRMIAANGSSPTESNPSVASLTRDGVDTATLALNPGETATLHVPTPDIAASHQWKRNGSAVSGATGPSLVIPAVTTADMGFYSVVSTRDAVSTESLVATVIVASTGTSRLANLSTRGVIPAGGTLTPGFTLDGQGSARLLVRAVGPTLNRFGIANATRDPTLELVRANDAAVVCANDDWASGGGALDIADTTTTVGAFGLESSAKDAAIVTAFDAGRSYTARIAGKDAAAGVVLAEVYDTGDANAAARLTAVSTLGFAGAGDHALVSGFTISGTAAKRLLIRAVGPALAAFGVLDALVDPRLAIAPAGRNFTIAASDDWNDPAIVTASATAGAFALPTGSKDAALVMALPPGAYTVTVTGNGAAAGTALVEIYDLDR